jgi:hypothetical protein
MVASRWTVILRLSGGRHQYHKAQCHNQSFHGIRF